MDNEANMFGSIVPGAYVAFGISLPLVAAFVVTHLTDLKGTSTIKESKEGSSFASTKIDFIF